MRYPGWFWHQVKLDAQLDALRDLLDTVEAIKERGAGRSLADNTDMTTPAGELIVHIFASITHFERHRIAERALERLDAVRKRGHRI